MTREAGPVKNSKTANVNGGLMKLVYNGVHIRNSGDDFLNLTDMWKACGSDPSKAPKNWLRGPGKEFIEFIAENQKVSLDHLLKIEHGRNGGTWAHWQIGLAYAKYLSHEFHARCNKVVRDHIEGVGLRHLTEAERRQLEQFVRTIPVATGPKWAWDIVDLFAELYDKPRPDRNKSPPVWFRGVVGRLHKLRFPQPIIDALREFALGSSGAPRRYADYMQPAALAVLGELQNIVRGVGSQFPRGQARAAMGAIAEHCNAINGLGAQLTLAVSCGCGNRLGLTDRFCSQCGARRAA